MPRQGSPALRPHALPGRLPPGRTRRLPRAARTVLAHKHRAGISGRWARTSWLSTPRRPPIRPRTARPAKHAPRYWLPARPRIRERALSHTPPAVPRSHVRASALVSHSFSESAFAPLPKTRGGSGRCTGWTDAERHRHRQHCIWRSWLQLAGVRVLSLLVHSHALSGRLF